MYVYVYCVYYCLYHCFGFLTSNAELHALRSSSGHINVYFNEHSPTEILTVIHLY